jgi:thioredoxin-related protein
MNLTTAITATRLLLVLTVLVTSVTLASVSDARNAREFFFTLTFGNLPEEMDIARGDGKLGMLLFFEAEDCPYCHHMLKNVFNQVNVQDWYQERFVSIAIDIHGDVEMQDFSGITLPSKVFADQQGVFLTPVMSFVDLDGEEIYRHLGMIGTPQEFLLLGEYVVDGQYKNTRYDDFSKACGVENSDGTLNTPAVEDSGETK